MIVDFKSTPLEPLALKARVVQFNPLAATPVAVAFMFAPPVTLVPGPLPIIGVHVEPERGFIFNRAASVPAFHLRRRRRWRLVQRWRSRRRCWWRQERLWQISS